MENNYVGAIVSRLNTLSNSINTLERLSNEEIMFEESNSWSKVQTTLSNLRTDISEKFSCFLAQLLKKDSNLRSGNITKLKEELKSL